MSKKVLLAEICEIFDGPHATPARVTEGPFFLNIASLENGHLNASKSDRVSEEDFRKWTRRVEPKVGDVLFSYETRLGEAALMPTGIRACLGRRMALMRPDRDRVDPRFLLYYYLSPEFQRFIEQNTIHGATVNRIGLSSMGKWPIRLPSMADQILVAEALGVLDEKIDANLRINDTLTFLRDTLLPELMSGRMRVRDAEEQVGEVL